MMGLFFDRRPEAMRQVAESWGFRFQDTVPIAELHDFAQPWRAFRPVASQPYIKASFDHLPGEGLHIMESIMGTLKVLPITNVIEGTRSGFQVVLFDLTRGSSSSRGSKRNNTSIRRTTLLGLQSDSLALPAFTLSKETIFDKIVCWFGAQDIDFDENPIFSSHYRLKGEDEEAVRAFFTSDLRWDFEDETDTYKGLTIEGSGDRLMLFRTGVRVDPARLETFVDKGIALAQRMADTD